MTFGLQNHNIRWRVSSYVRTYKISKNQKYTRQYELGFIDYDFFIKNSNVRHSRVKIERYKCTHICIFFFVRVIDISEIFTSKLQLRIQNYGNK